MQNKKKRNKEIERQLRQKKKLFTGVVIAICAVVVLAIVWVIWDAQNRRWLMTFEGERIAVSDLQFFSNVMGMGLDDEWARDFFTDELIKTLTVMERAERHNMGLTPTEREELEMMAYGMEFISEQRAAQLMGSWGMSNFMGGIGGEVYDRLLDFYVPNYTPDPVQFQEELQEYIDENRDFYADLQVKYIASVTFEDIVNAQMRLEFEEDITFDDLIRDHSMLFDEEEGISAFSAMEFIQIYNVWDDWEEIFALEEGEFSQIIEVGGLFFWVQMYSRTDADLDEMEESFREQFVARGRAITFDELVQTWVEAANYSINSRAFNNLA